MKRRTFSPTRVALLFLGVMIGLAMTGGAAGLLMTKGFTLALKPAPVTAMQARTQTPPEPRLQVDPLADRQVMIGPERQASTSGLTNGHRHIPVEAAMRMLAQQGWPQSDEAAR